MSISDRARRRIRGAAVLLAGAGAVAIAGSPAAAAPNSYIQHNLVSSIPGAADHPDSDLVNAWGLGARPTSPWWVADNGTDQSTLYTANGTKLGLIVSVPSAPTGLVANIGSGFPAHQGMLSASSLFLFSTEDGGILGWNPTVAPTTAVDGPASTPANAVFKGLAIASTPSGDRLYATDFHNAQVDVWDGNWTPVHRVGAFDDPNLPPMYAPFGIQSIGGGRIVVTYARQGPGAHDELDHPGAGFVDLYDTAGNLITRIAGRGVLNAPWGIAQAPATGFGQFSGDLLVGNFGDGRIHAFGPEDVSGRYQLLGALRTPSGSLLSIDRLWALEFGLGSLVNNGPKTTLFFTAGPRDESEGLFGTIVAGP
jgi:uncharacterized protein (TIGR03118 family)